MKPADVATTLEETKKLLIAAFDKSLLNKRSLLVFKDAAIRLQDFQLAASIRDVEKLMFPESQELKEAKIYTSAVQLTLSAMGVKAPDSTLWLVSKTIERHKEKGDQFSLKDAAELTAESQRIFADEN